MKPMLYMRVLCRQFFDDSKRNGANRAVFYCNEGACSPAAGEAFATEKFAGNVEVIKYHPPFVRQGGGLKRTTLHRM